MPSRRTRLAVLATALATLGGGSVVAGPGGTTAASESGSARPETASAPVAASVPAAASTGVAQSTNSSTNSSTGDTPHSAERTTGTSSPTPPKPPGPRKVLPDRMRGAAAVRALGADLPAAAARSGVSAAQLRRVLTTDRTAWVSETGRLFYIEAAPQGTTGTTAAGTVAPAFATSETFALNSRPGASRTIFLDFDGATVSGTDWNTGTDAIAAGTHIGYDSDGTPGTFSTAERGYIQEVWRQVAETYAAFDVNVTTQDTGTDAYTRTSAADPTYGTHVVITSSTTPQQQVCAGACLGVAYVGTFSSPDNSYYQPAWVFAAGINDPTTIAQAASHEAGHNLGLDHDATSAMPTYYPGTAAWGPIMGSARPRAVSQFSRGEYADANNTQDDLAIITSNGLPVRTDDFGNDTAGAQQLGALPAYAAAGVISTRTDKDVFAINLSCTTGLTVTATGVGAQATLDLSLEVLNQAGAVVGSSSLTSSWSWPSGTAAPVSTNMDAEVTVPSATGIYYLRVDGVGSGNPAGTGWSDYASLGQYSIAATGCPDVAPAAESFPSTTPSPSTAPTTAPMTPTVTAAPTPTATPTTTPTATPTPVATKPGYPVIGKASSGYSGGTVSATARWAAPSSTGGAAITKYRVRAQKRDSRNRVIRTYYSGYYGSTTRALVWRLPRGRYSFAVMAWNRVGASAWSRSSSIVTAR